MRGEPEVDPSDEALVAAFVGGDERAFATLVGRYERRVLGICLRYLRDPADAEDAAQDAFLALYRRAGTFRGGSRFSTWMYRVTTNACTDLVRRRGRRPQRTADDIGELPLADRTDRVEERLLQLELQDALEQLDPIHREVVVAHTVRGLAYHEIAASQGVAVGTVKSRVHRAHAKLAAILADGGGERSGVAPRPTGRGHAGPAPPGHDPPDAPRPDPPPRTTDHTEDTSPT